ncbi:MAG: hypothetical protein ACREOA_09010 [Candidatus Dormibacteria bacterium]
MSRGSPTLPLWPVTMTGVGDEAEAAPGTDPTQGLHPAPGHMSLRLLRSPEGVTLGSSLTRRPEVVAAIQAILGVGAVRTSHIGGTVGPGGGHWLGLFAVARLPDPCPRPLDQLTSSLRAYLEARLGESGVQLQLGRVDGAWCPGFSDLSVRGRKLVGLGLRLTAGWGLVRGVVAVSPPGPAELQRLDACHRAFGPGLDPEKLISLAELPGLSGIDREAAIQLLGATVGAPAKMSP